MDFALAPEDEKFRDELRAWLDEHLPPFLEAESLGDDASLSGEASQQRRQKWQRMLHEGGWAAIHWGPEYAQGRTINAMQRLLYSEVMAEYRTPGMFNTNGIWQIGPMIIAWGTEEQKAQWLPSILEAEEHWCQGFSEPMAGNDLANLRTTAIYDPDSDEYVINGSKIWISSAHLATWGLFLLRTDPTAIERGKKHEGITAFVLNLTSPGIEVRPIRDMAGEELFNEIFFTDVRVPARWRLGDEGAGWMVAMGTLGYERVGIASQIAILAADLRAMVAAARSVNPGALEDPSLRDRIARVWTEIELARLLSLRALSKIMKGEKNWPEVPFAKLSWSSMAQTLAELAVDLLGPVGALARGGPDAVDRGKWTRLYAFQRYSTIGGGSTEIQKNIIADRAIAMPGTRARLTRAALLPADPRAACIIGVARRTWHPADAPDGAPEPLAMWEQMARDAAADTEAADASSLLGALESIDVVYSQSWQYDDAVARLAERIGASPARRRYSGIGGSVPQVLAGETAAEIRAGRLDLALLTGAEALATVRRLKKAGEKPPWSFRPAEKRPFPMDMDFDPSEISHAVFEAYLTFALFDNARRAHLGRGLDEHRAALGRVLAPMTAVAAASPHAWFPVAREASEIVTAAPDNRMVAYPYTKLMTSIMDVDMAAAVILASAAKADALGVPAERRVYLRGSGYAEDPSHVAGHPDLWRSPAMAAAADAALAGAGIGVDDVAHLDLYSCFASSVCFALDALGISEDDPRAHAVTQTGGLPYHGGPGSNYMTHALAAMAEKLRREPGSFGLTSGVGMHMQKHAYGVWSTDPGAAPAGAAPADAGAHSPAAADPVPIVEAPEGTATIATYSVLHGRDSRPERALLICDLPNGGRCYALLDGGAGALEGAEADELVGRTVTLRPADRVNHARLR